MGASSILRAPGSRVLLMGNEAIARGAIEAGVSVATGYPGNPSSEIIDTLAEVADKTGMYVEWSVNEKVAFEIALAAAYSRVRAMSSMKHVGVNVALDTVVTAAYMGVRAGLVLVSCDDPGSWSSQNEQDNRILGLHAYLPVFEPCNPQEAKDMMVYALGFSERMGHPVMLRSTTFVSHAIGDVVLGGVERRVNRRPVWERDVDVAVFDSRGARLNRARLLKRWEAIKNEVEKSPFNKSVVRDSRFNGARVGLIASGASYVHLVDALRAAGLEDKVSVLKISTTNPVPRRLVLEFLQSVDRVLVVEELEPFLETHIKALAQEAGVRVEIRGKEYVPIQGELNPSKVLYAVTRFLGLRGIGYADLERVNAIKSKANKILPPRPPVLCPGCPYRIPFFSIRKTTRGKNPIFPGDIGCYGLGYLPPFEVIDTILSMGAGIGMANGFSLLFPDRPILALVGDSTFFHAAMPAIANAVHHNRRMTIVVLDNDVTAMTGDQPHPGSSRDAMGNPSNRVLIEEVVRGLGVRHVEVVDPSDRLASERAIRRALSADGVSVVVFRRPCELVRVRDKNKSGEPVVPYQVDPGKCTACKICYKLFSCPAITKLEDGKASIEPSMCTGCGDCAQVCPFDAIHPVAEVVGEERVGAS